MADSSARSQGVWSARRVAGAYLAVGLTWIVVSDLAAHGAAGRAGGQLWTDIAKGSLFVVVTAVILYGLLLRHLRRQAEAEQARADMQARVTQILETLSEVVWSVDLTRPGRSWVGGAALEIYGRPAQAFRTQPDLWREAVHPEDRPLADARERSVRQRGEAEAVYRVVRPDGTVRWLHDRARRIDDADGRPIRLLGVARDVTAQKEAELAARHARLHDPLTGLMNRAALIERLERHFDEPDSRGLGVLLAIDLDGFGAINAAHGDRAGDQVLGAVAERLQGVVSNVTAVLGRIGGDEFAVFLPALADPADARETVLRVQTALARPISEVGGEALVSASVGVAAAARLTDSDGAPAENLLRSALGALSRAKIERGGGSAASVVEDVTDSAREVRLRVDLHHALERDELFLAYQPEFDLRSGRLLGVEALVRWQHPTEGLVPPDAFIGVAETTGLIHGLGSYVVARACAQARDWLPQMADRPFKVWINLSRVQLQRAGFADQLIAEVDATGVPHERLGFEITESAYADDAGLVRDNLDTLSAAGFGLALDDFGTGWSSLASLRTLPIDVVKIDRAFVSDLTPDGPNERLIQAIVGMSHALRLTVLAEGIEARGDVERLVELGCDVGQGYGLGRPGPPEAVESMLGSPTPIARPALLASLGPTDADDQGPGHPRR